MKRASSIFLPFQFLSPGKEIFLYQLNVFCLTLSERKNHLLTSCSWHHSGAALPYHRNVDLSPQHISPYIRYTVFCLWRFLRKENDQIKIINSIECGIKNIFNFILAEDWAMLVLPTNERLCLFISIIFVWNVDWVQIKFQEYLKCL